MIGILQMTPWPLGLGWPMENEDPETSEMLKIDPR